jgi:hypothetical protein
MMDANFQLYQRVTDDADFGRFFLGLLFERFLDRKRKTAGENALPEGAAAHGEGGWRHTRITLSPLNPEFEPIEVRPEDQDAFRVLAEFVAVIGTERGGG